MSESKLQKDLKNLNIEKKATILAKEVVGRHDKLANSANRAIIENEMKQSFINMQREGKIDIDKLLDKTQAKEKTHQPVPQEH